MLAVVPAVLGRPDAVLGQFSGKENELFQKINSPLLDYNSKIRNPFSTQLTLFFLPLALTRNKFLQYEVKREDGSV